MEDVVDEVIVASLELSRSVNLDRDHGAAEVVDDGEMRGEEEAAGLQGSVSMVEEGGERGGGSVGEGTGGDEQQEEGGGGGSVGEGTGGDEQQEEGGGGGGQEEEEEEEGPSGGTLLDHLIASLPASPFPDEAGGAPEADEASLLISIARD